MIKLSIDDNKKLLEILMPMPILTTEKGREAVFISASLDELRPQIDLSGPSSIAIPILINRLCAYGRLNYEHEALGRFLNTIKNYTGIEDSQFFNYIISKYNLMVPIAKLSKITDWKKSVSAEEVAERIIGENTLRPIAFLQKGLNSSRSVAYIEVSSDSIKWSGTGFLVSPNLLLTNHHVLPREGLASKAFFRFNYQHDIKGNAEISKDYTAKGVYFSNEFLDYAIVELKDDPGNEWGYLNYSLDIPLIESRVNIIQHPNGLPKQISIQNNFIKYADTTKIQYITSTLPGSSGSPVLNDNWEVVGLHHAGGWLREKEGSPLYFRNEGIMIRAIINDIPIEIRNSLAFDLR
jgi:V8-like Glu-specific endopeptidase